MNNKLLWVIGVVVIIVAILIGFSSENKTRLAPGDANADRVIDERDVIDILLKKKLSGNGDFDNDKKVDWKDALEILLIMQRNGQTGESSGGSLPAICNEEFYRGDANSDASVNIADVITMLTELFGESQGDMPCQDVGDVNDDNNFNIADPIYTLSSLFVVGAPKITDTYNSDYGSILVAVPGVDEKCDFDDNDNDGIFDEACREASWEKSYGSKTSGPFGDTDVAGFSIDQAEDGNYVVGGYILEDSDESFLLTKFDRVGNFMWYETYGGSNNERANSIQLTMANGEPDGFIMVGWTESVGAGGKDVWLVKTDLAGNEQWSYPFGGTGKDIGHDVKQTSDGGYIIAGERFELGQGQDAYLIKTDSSGNLEWEETYEPTVLIEHKDDIAYSVDEASDGGYVFSGSTESDDVFNKGAWYAKIDRRYQTIEWDETVQGGATVNDIAYEIMETTDSVSGEPDGYMYVAVVDFNTPFPNPEADIFVHKLDFAGGYLYFNQILFASSAAEAEVPYAMEQISDGSYVIVGSYGPPVHPSWGVKMVRLSEDLLFAVQDTYTDTNQYFNHYASDVTETVDLAGEPDGFIIISVEEDPFIDINNIHLLKTDQNGQIL